MNTFTPGYTKSKLLMIALGIIVLALGLMRLWTPLRVVVLGQRVRAEATVVIKTKAGVPDRVLSDDAQILASLEPRDRSYIFWNEFTFHSTDGHSVTVRAPVASQLKPLYSLLDADGLPTTDVIYYDPTDPTTVVFPLIVSTWFAAGVLVLGGLLCVGIGAVLLCWANKPIELPHIPAPPAQ